MSEKGFRQGSGIYLSLRIIFLLLLPKIPIWLPHAGTQVYHLVKTHISALALVGAGGSFGKGPAAQHTHTTSHMPVVPDS